MSLIGVQGSGARIDHSGDDVRCGSSAGGSGIAGVRGDSSADIIIGGEGIRRIAKTWEVGAFVEFTVWCRSLQTQMHPLYRFRPETTPARPSRAWQQGPLPLGLSNRQHVANPARNDSQFELSGVNVHAGGWEPILPATSPHLQ